MTSAADIRPGSQAHRGLVLAWPKPEVGAHHTGRMTNNMRLLIVALVAGIAIAVAGCGDDDDITVEAEDVEPTVAVSTPEAAASPEPEPTPSGMTIDEYREAYRELSDTMNTELLRSNADFE
jgi:hypothetical protein